VTGRHCDANAKVAALTRASALASLFQKHSANTLVAQPVHDFDELASNARLERRVSRAFYDMHLRLGECSAQVVRRLDRAHQVPPPLHDPRRDVPDSVDVCLFEQPTVALEEPGVLELCRYTIKIWTH
jgi:hypothetical protein